MRIPSIVVIAGLLIAVATGGEARAGVDVHIGIHIPPPPVIVFEREPEVVIVPHTKVYYVPNQDYDLFRYAGFWYVNRGGYWYRAHTYRGPFVPIAYARVPRAVIVTPAQFHHYPLRPPPPHAGPHGHFRHRGQVGRVYGHDQRP